MPHIHLPAEHTVADLALAGEIAGVLKSRELYVVWTHGRGGNAPPAVTAELREPAPPALVDVFTVMVQAVIDVWRSLTGPRVQPAAPAPAQRTTA